jgi:DinB superfamily
MKELIEELNALIEHTTKVWTAIPKSSWFHKPKPEKWSKSEVAGHLVDSAMNNIQRFIRAQYEDAPNLFYNQNEWVRLNHYETVEKEDLILLWSLLNRQISRIIKNIPTENLELPCHFKVDGQLQIVTLQYVIEDYVAHLKHHLGQITEG